MGWEGEFEGVTRLVQENLFLALSFIFLLSRPNRFEDQPKDTPSRSQLIIEDLSGKKHSSYGSSARINLSQ